MRRVLVGRALLPEPEVLLLDEPTSALDPPTARRVLDELGDLARVHGLTLVVVSHRLDEAARFASHAAVLDAGRLRAAGPAEAILDELRADWEEES